MKTWCLVLTCVIVASLSSCQDPGLLLPTLDSAQGKALVSAVSQGSILKPGDSIPLSIDHSALNGQNPDSIKVVLLDASTTINPTQFLNVNFNQRDLSSGTGPIVILPELQPDAYKLMFTSYSQSKILQVDSLLFFVEDAIPQLRGIVVQPGTLKPGSDGLLELLVDLPDTGDAWIRWSAGSSVLKTDMASSGGKRVVITAPTTEGIYSYQAEVFPLAPAHGQDYSFTSPYLVENRVVVSNKSSSSTVDIGPDSDFSHILHLQGNVLDSGWANTKGQFSLTGAHYFDSQNNALGYVLGAGSAILYNQALIPDFSHIFPALAVHFRLLPVATNSGMIYRSRTMDGSSGLEFSLTDKAELSVRIWSRDFDRELKVPSPLLLSNPADIQIVLSRNETALQLLLILNGETLAVTNIESIAAPEEIGVHYQAGKTEIGHPGGPRFLLDEFGVYQPARAVGDAYFLAMQYRYGKALSFAHAFASGVLPKGFKADGDVRVAGGNLIIPPGASVILPELDTIKHIVNIEITFAETSADHNSIVSLEADKMIAGVINLNGTISQGGRHSQIPGFSIEPMRFSLQATKTGYEIHFSNFQFGLTAASPQILTIRVANSVHGLASLELSSILGAELFPDSAYGEL